MGERFFLTMDEARRFALPSRHSDWLVLVLQLCNDLITCLISFHLGDNATTDAVSERLRQLCPSLFTVDDATKAKVTSCSSTLFSWWQS